MGMNHRPTHDWIIVKIHEVTSTMPVVRGLYTPGHVVDPKKYGVVLAVGPGRYSVYTGRTVPLPCVVGDTVMIRNVAGDRTVIDGEEYHWCEPGEILAVVAESRVLPNTGHMGDLSDPQMGELQAHRHYESGLS